MELKKAIKKVVALGAGAAMVGTTIMGAMAASLADYPAPFVADGKFNGHIVVGDNAKAEDVIGATDIIASLQYQMKKTTTVSTGTGASSVTIEGDSWKAETSTKKLELGEDMSSIQTTITESELNALADGSIRAKNTADYEQEIKLSSNLVLSYEKDTDNDVVGDFLTINSDEEIATYKLTFKTAAESDIDTTNSKLEDLEDATISILGEDYTITKADYSANALTLELMGGSVTDVLEEMQTKTYTVNGKEYEVTVSYIGSETTKLTVNGATTKALKDGQTATVAGIDIGIREILDQNLAGEIDKVEFYLGADKITLYDSNATDSVYDGRMDIGEERMDEVTVGIKGSENAGDFLLEMIQLNYTADDDYWIGAGQKLSEKLEEPQALINWDISYEGMSSAATESIDIVSSGDQKAVLKVTLADGAATIPLAYSADNSSVRLGDSNNKMVLDKSLIQKDQYFFLTTGSGVPSAQGEKSYILQYKGADSSSGDITATLKFKNVATGATIERSFNIGTSSATLTLGGEEFTIANTSDATASKDNFNINVSGGASDGYLVTKGDALIKIVDANETDDTGDITVVVVEVDPASMVESDVATSFQVTLDKGDADEIGIGAPNLSMESDPDDSDVETAMTVYGAKITSTSVSSAPDKVEVVWPAAQLTGQAFVTSGATTSIASSAGGTVETQEIVKIDVGAAILASEVAGEETMKNLILVGGPCANRAASVIMGNPENCAEGFEAGKAMIKLYTHANEKVALLVAGDQAMDTRGACQYVANYDKNKATFDAATDEIALTVTSLSQISASVPQ